jgi:hypothetical protein
MQRAYQSATKGKVAVPEPVAREACPSRPRRLCRPVRESRTATPGAAPARRIDPDELAALLKRAKGLLAIGDITSARLLLERGGGRAGARGGADAGRHV